MKDLDVLRQRHEVHNSAVGIVAECRAWAAQFLKKTAQDEPGLAKELSKAAKHYKKIHDLMWEVWGLVGGNGHPEAHIRFAEPDIRRKIADTLSQAKELDEQAAEHLEKAVS